MGVPKAQCNGCEKRHNLCHADCEIYKQYKEQAAEYERRRKAVINAEQDWYKAREYTKSRKKRLKQW